VKTTGRFLVMTTQLLPYFADNKSCSSPPCDAQRSWRC
jgi:hypothetical protein